MTVSELEARASVDIVARMMDMVHMRCRSHLFMLVYACILYIHVTSVCVCVLRYFPGIFCKDI